MRDTRDRRLKSRCEVDKVSLRIIDAVDAGPGMNGLSYLERMFVPAVRYDYARWVYAALEAHRQAVREMVKKLQGQLSEAKAKTDGVS